MQNCILTLLFFYKGLLVILGLPSSSGRGEEKGRRSMEGVRAVDVRNLLQEGVCILTGGRDRRGGAILTFPQNPKRERMKPEDLKRLILYLASIPK